MILIRSSTYKNKAERRERKICFFFQIMWLSFQLVWWTGGFVLLLPLPPPPFFGGGGGGDLGRQFDLGLDLVKAGNCMVLQLQFWSLFEVRGIACNWNCSFGAGLLKGAIAWDWKWSK